MKKTSQDAKKLIDQAEELLQRVAVCICGLVFVALTAQFAIWIRAEIFVNARMDSSEYLSRIRSSCKKEEGCAGIKISFDHLWAPPGDRFTVFGTHMRVDVQPTPKAGNRPEGPIIATLTPQERQFTQIYVSGVAKPSTLRKD